MSKPWQLLFSGKWIIERKRKREREIFRHPHCALNEPIVVGCNELTISTWGSFLFCFWDKASLCKGQKWSITAAGLRALIDRWGETEHDKKSKMKWEKREQQHEEIHNCDGSDWRDVKDAERPDHQHGHNNTRPRSSHLDIHQEGSWAPLCSSYRTYQVYNTPSPPGRKIIIKEQHGLLFIPLQFIYTSYFPHQPHVLTSFLKLFMFVFPTIFTHMNKILHKFQI